MERNSNQNVIIALTPCFEKLLHAIEVQNKLLSKIVEKKELSLLIDSKDYADQNANDLTIILDEELSSITKIQINYIGFPCTFYNISEELKITELVFTLRGSLQHYDT